MVFVKEIFYKHFLACDIAAESSNMTKGIETLLSISDALEFLNRANNLNDFLVMAFTVFCFIYLVKCIVIAAHVHVFSIFL